MNVFNRNKRILSTLGEAQTLFADMSQFSPAFSQLLYQHKQKQQQQWNPLSNNFNSQLADSHHTTSKVLTVCSKSVSDKECGETKFGITPESVDHQRERVQEHAPSEKENETREPVTAAEPRPPNKPKPPGPKRPHPHPAFNEAWSDEEFDEEA
jgi:hypothetical protein